MGKNGNAQEGKRGIKEPIGGVLCPNCGETMEGVEQAFVCSECQIWMMGGKVFPLREGYVSGKCPNCDGCGAWELDRGYNIPQAGINSCPVCGMSGWFVSNRCNLCDHKHCPRIFEDDVWAPGLALLEGGN